MLAHIASTILGFYRDSFSLAVFFRPFYTPPPTAQKLDHIRSRWQFRQRVIDARSETATATSTPIKLATFALSICLLLTGGLSTFAAPQTPFSTNNSAPAFAEPSFGALGFDAPKFSKSFEENISFDLPKSTHSISLKADQVEHWLDGDFEVLHLQGNVHIQQATLTATAGEAIVWIEIPDSDPNAAVPPTPHQVLVYLEDKVTVDLASQSLPHQSNDRIIDQAWFGRLQTTGTVDLARRATELTASKPLLFNRARQARDKNQPNPIQQTAFLQSFPIDPLGGSLTSDGQVWVEDNQFTSSSAVAQRPQTVVNPITGQLQTVPTGGFQQATPAFAPTTPTQAGGQLTQRGSPFKILLSRRDPSVSLDLKNFVNPNNPNEKVTLLTGGIRLAIESPAISDLRLFQDDADRKLFVSADNAVQWQLNLPDGSRRNQFYLEGDVVFSKGARVINAESMFYDVESQQGTILKADMRTNVSGINGPVRVKADVVQQQGENNIQAFGTAVTTSRLGVPRYWFQSESLSLREQPSPAFDPNAGVAATNLSNGLSNFQTDAPGTDFTMEAQRNRIYLGGVPVFAWPRIQTTLSDPTLYLESFSLNNDNIFGTQIRTGWDINQILGIQPAAGTRWIGNVDYLSERGLAVGSEFDYQRDGLFGIPGRVRGSYESWYLIDDDGTDNLGRDRTSLIPEEDFRGRTIFEHRHDFAPGYQLRAELGFISDRNFLEQFYEREWDTDKDATTGFWLERNVGTNSYNLTGDLHLNDFFAQTSGINYNQFKLGQPILNNRAIWHANAHAGYQRLRQADAPTDPIDAAKFDPLAWEADVDGFTAGTRHEIDFPMQIGPAKVVPYLLGDVSYWQEALDGSDLARAYGQVGVRASVPMWRVDPSIKSILWNVDGLAHKVSFDVDAFFAEATQDLDELPLYNQLDDDAQEHFRRRFAFDTFNIFPGGDTPLQFDERYFALRSGIQSNITAAASEIADDLTLVKLGVRQKWQTKRGLPGQQRIIDWITLDTQATLFPKANRDNFGSDFGMFDYDFRWYLGDRLSLVSDGYFDFFSQGLRTASVGANISRPGNGNAYVGFRTIEGPISSNILSASLSYRMSDKWGLNAGGQVDFGDTGTIGQTLSLIYIGESFLWQFGFNFDHSRDNFGFRFGFEPRFTKRPQLFQPGGQPIQPAGSRWLE